MTNRPFYRFHANDSSYWINRVCAGDILAGATRQLMGGRSWGVFYSDPPWGEGLVRMVSHDERRVRKLFFDGRRFIERFGMTQLSSARC